MHGVWLVFHDLGGLEIYIGWGIYACTMWWICFWPLKMQCSLLPMMLVPWDDLAMSIFFYYKF